MSELNSEDLRALVREELERSEIRSLVDDTRGRSRLGGFFAHPLIVTIAGFLMTTGVLFVIEQRIAASERTLQDYEREHAAIHREADATLAQLDELIELMNRRAIEANLTASAINRGSVDEAKARKARYDNYFRDWGATYDARVRVILDYIGVEEKRFGKDAIYRAVQTSVGSNRFRPMDGCVTKAFDLARKAAPVLLAGSGAPAYNTACRALLGAVDPDKADAWKSVMTRLRSETHTCSTALFFHTRKRILQRRDYLIAELDHKRHHARWLSFGGALDAPFAPIALIEEPLLNCA